MLKPVICAVLFTIVSMGAQAAAPVAKIKTALTVSMPVPASFSGNDSTCDGGRCRFFWNFGDGTSSDPVKDIDANFIGHPYASAGTYTVVLTVKDVNGVSATASVQIKAAVAKTFSSYVDACRQQVGFSDAEVAAVASSLNCNKAVQFAPPEVGDAVNDFLGYARINESVDLAFACRWLDNRTANRFSPNNPFLPPFVQAASVEMIMHNRGNGNTCYFQAKERPISGPDGVNEPGVPVALVSPTVAAAAAPNTPEANFWATPAEMESRLPCVDCHVAGPYISTPRIAPFLAQFGLLNNGHDTLGLFFDGQGNPKGRYHAIGSTLDSFNIMIATNNSSDGCTNGCHSIAYGSQVDKVEHGVIGSDFPRELLPAIKDVIDVNQAGLPDVSIPKAGVMPANYDPFSHYRWVNMDTPTSDTGEYETLLGLGQRFPNFYCSNPTGFEAHVVGINNQFRPNDLPDKLHTMNLRDGVVCLNAEQGAGKQCHDYRTRYLCGGAWSGWYNTDSPTYDGDHEERSRDTGLCASPTAMQVAYNAGSTQDPEFIWFGAPNDRLAQFDNKGLVCKNADQGAGQTCSNYVVRFICNSTTQPPTALPVTNRRADNIGVAEVTYVVTENIVGWTAWNTSGRQIYVNGIPLTAGQALPPKTNDGKYYFTFSAGGLSYAGWNYW